MIDRPRDNTDLQKVLQEVHVAVVFDTNESDTGQVLDLILIFTCKYVPGNNKISSST